MSRCNHGQRTEDCECRQLFRLYISSNHAGFIGTVSVPGNTAKLLEGRSIKDKRTMLHEIKTLCDRFYAEVMEQAGINEVKEALEHE